jgi:hypothetical protein
MATNETTEQLYLSYCRAYVLVRSNRPLEPTEFANYTDGRWAAAAMATNDAKNERPPRARLDVQVQVTAMLSAEAPRP